MPTYDGSLTGTHVPRRCLPAPFPSPGGPSHVRRNARHHRDHDHKGLGARPRARLAHRHRRRPDRCRRSERPRQVDAASGAGGGRRTGEEVDWRADKILARVGLDVPFDRRSGSLSGGERARLALASILLARFDVYLLDEPTNDLDFAGLELLERFLTSVDAGVVVVSHDRAFLDRTVSRILELGSGTQRVREFVGGWSDYEATRERVPRDHERAYGRWDRAAPVPRSPPRSARAGAHARQGRRAARDARADVQDPGGCPAAGAAGASQGREALAAVGAGALARARGPGRRHRARTGSGGPGARRVQARPDRPPRRVGRADLDRGTERPGQVDAARRPARRARPDGGDTTDRAERCGRPARPGALAPGAGPRPRRRLRRPDAAADGGSPHPAGQVRPVRAGRAPAGGDALTG
jgi:energy-coupling factor transporter ATP-binding protein EcfA2